MENLDFLDAQTRDLIIQLYLGDVDDITSHGKGKNRDGEQTDWELALSSYKSELELYAIQVSDRAMCESIIRAVAQDAGQIQASLGEEQQAYDDRDAAIRLAPPGTAISQSRQSTPLPPVLDHVLLAELEALNIGSSPLDSELPIAESSSWAASRPSQRQDQDRCVACDETVPSSKIIRAPCGHKYCHGCVEDHTRISLSDESLFPPRCCGQTFALTPDEDENGVFAFLPEALFAQFLAKKDEFGTTNRTYCHIPTCSTFLSTKTCINGDKGTCPKCGSITCTICKNAEHDNECPEDAASQEVLRIAQENGWQRCQSCKRVVELHHGCNHMTCLCGHQFCYVCGERWKRCGCPQWHEERLLARAEDLVNRDAGQRRGAIDHATRAHLIQTAQTFLVQNHQCDHTRWRFRRGENTCEECHDTLPQFIFECTRCRMLACKRCRYNRL